MVPNRLGGLSEGVQTAFDKAISVNESVVKAYVGSLRRRLPDATPEELVRKLEKRYLASVVGSGTAVGAGAAAPGVGTGVSLALSAGETVTSLEAAMLLVLAVAETHGMPIEDVQRRRTLLLSLLIGDKGPKAIQQVAGRTGKHWGKLVADSVPMSAIKAVNKVLGHRFVTRYGRRQGLIVLGREAPFGIGAGIGAGGGYLSGRSVVAGVRTAFGPRRNPSPTGSTRSRKREPSDRIHWTRSARVRGVVHVALDAVVAGPRITGIVPGLLWPAPPELARRRRRDRGLCCETRRRRGTDSANRGTAAGSVVLPSDQPRRTRRRSSGGRAGS
jgi:hypothetical protein